MGQVVITWKDSSEGFRLPLFEFWLPPCLSLTFYNQPEVSREVNLQAGVQRQDLCKHCSGGGSGCVFPPSAEELSGLACAELLIPAALQGLSYPLHLPGTHC